MKGNIYIYIAVMAVVTYLIRMLPLALIKKKITNRFFKSFLYYVPFVTLAVMTFPAIIYATSNVYAAWGGFIVAIIMACRKKSLPQVALAACVVVFLMELILA